MSLSTRNQLVEDYLGVVQSVISSSPTSPSVQRDREEVEADLSLALVEAATDHLEGGYHPHAFNEYARMVLSQRLQKLDRATIRQDRREVVEVSEQVMADLGWDKQAALDYFASLSDDDKHFLKVYHQCNRNLRATAKQLKVHRNTANNTIRRLKALLLAQL